MKHPKRLALEHIRILDLTQAWSGAYATQILADQGAEVIKVEARQRTDVWRFGQGPARELPFYPADGPGERAYNRCFMANSVNRNKWGITLDLTRERGRDLFRGLVRISDVVAENYTPQVMTRFGLGYHTLRDLRPGLIMLSMPAYGGYGAYSDFVGVGNSIEPMSGNSSLLGYEDGRPLNSGLMVSDPVAGLLGAISVLLALQFRNRTGRGQHIDLSQQEAMATMLGYHVLAHSLTGKDQGRQGNQDPAMAPHGNYRCQGEDQWVAVAVRDDAEWTRLCALMGQPRLADDPRFTTTSARLENRTMIDGLIERWTSNLTPEEVETRLRAAGIPVGRVRTLADVHACPQLNSRRFFVSPEHPEVGRRRTPGIPVRLSHSPGRVRRPAPCLGEHSAQVLRAYLGLSDAEIADLIIEGITGEDPISIDPTPESPAANSRVPATAAAR